MEHYFENCTYINLPNSHNNPLRKISLSHSTGEKLKHRNFKITLLRRPQANPNHAGS